MCIKKDKSELLKVGCEHNIRRRLVYPSIEPGYIKHPKSTIQLGQSISLICTEVCETIYILVSVKKDQDKKLVKKAKKKIKYEYT